MKTVYHAAASRGAANFGWLDSKHSFSFGRYYNPEKIHFGALRVLNDDIVTGGAGFGKHPHDNMEIISIPLSGDLKHADSTGRGEIIRTGDVQIMSAGTGIQHSEFNPNEDKPVNFLQIWIFPKVRNIAPRYDQKAFSAEGRVNKFQTVVAPDDENALWINQDAYLSLGDFDGGSSAHYQMKNAGNGAYFFILEGEATIAGQILGKRDAIGISETEQIDMAFSKSTKLLVIDVPMMEAEF